MAIGLLGACLGEGPGPADEPAAEVELQAITIAVTDSLSAGIVEGATVIVGGVQGTTGPDGRVTLEVPIGGVSIVVFHPDYDLAQAHVGNGVRETVVLLRWSAPLVDGCQKVEGRLSALATDLAGRKTLLRHSLSNVTIEGPGVRAGYHPHDRVELVPDRQLHCSPVRYAAGHAGHRGDLAHL